MNQADAKKTKNPHGPMRDLLVDQQIDERQQADCLVSSDLIDRQAAIDAVKKYAKFLWERFNGTCNIPGIIDAIEHVPPAKRLIRCEERPKEKGWYFLCYVSRWDGKEWWVPNYPDYWIGPPKEAQE